MRFPRTFGVKAICLALAVSLAPATLPAMPAGAPAPVSAIGAVFGTKAAEAGPRFHRGRHYRSHRRHLRHRRHYRRHRGGISSGGAAVLGSIIGLGVGAAIASQDRPTVVRRVPRRVHAAPRPWTRGWYRYCASKYRSFDARSGTYQPYHGPRRLCR